MEADDKQFSPKRGASKKHRPVKRQNARLKALSALRQAEVARAKLLKVQHRISAAGMGIGALFSHLSALADEVEEAKDSPTELLNVIRNMQEMQMSFNLQYLELQSQMQNENRSYSAVSNIMKTKHDTVKNSISNIR